MTNVVRSDKTIEDRARFGLGWDTQDDNVAPADTRKLLTAEGVVEDTTIDVTSGQYAFSRLAADSADVNASVVLVDSGLSVTLAVGTWQWEAVLMVTTAALADVRFQIAGTATVTAGSSDTFLVNGPGAVATVAVLPVKYTAYNTETTHATDGALADRPFILRGVATVTVAGTFKFQFAQGTSDASNTHIDAGSFLVARKVA